MTARMPSAKQARVAVQRQRLPDTAAARRHRLVQPPRRPAHERVVIDLKNPQHRARIHRPLDARRVEDHELVRLLGAPPESQHPVELERDVKVADRHRPFLPNLTQVAGSARHASSIVTLNHPTAPVFANLTRFASTDHLPSPGAFRSSSRPRLFDHPSAPISANLTRVASTADQLSPPVTNPSRPKFGIEVHRRRSSSACVPSRIAQRRFEDHQLAFREGSSHSDVFDRSLFEKGSYLPLMIKIASNLVLPETTRKTHSSFPSPFTT